MTPIADTFALCVYPNDAYTGDNSTHRGFTMKVRKKKYWLQDHNDSLALNFGVAKPFSNETDAWRHVKSNCPNFEQYMLQHASLSQRALVARAQLFLRLGEAAAQEKIQAVEEEILLILRHAMAGLSVVPVDDAGPNLTRERRNAFISWLRVTQQVRESTRPEPMWLGVCLLPSPIQDKTWTVQFDVNTQNNEMLEWLQRSHDRMTESLALEGIRVKDVLSGIRTI